MAGEPEWTSLWATWWFGKGRDFAVTHDKHELGREGYWQGWTGRQPDIDALKARVEELENKLERHHDHS